LENLNDSEDVNKAWENKENIEILGEKILKFVNLYALKQQKPWLDEECLQFLNQSKQDKM
jgi:hypothetical protein